MTETLIKLPTKPAIANPNKISKLVLISHQGTGKSTACSQLPNSLIIDLENGTEQLGGMNVNLLKEAANQNISLLKAFMETIKAIKQANTENAGAVYDYIVIDGITALEKLARQKATIDFKSSIVGKGMINKGAIINDVVTDVPESGWLWLHRTWDDLYTMLQGLAGHTIIFLAHSKQGSLVKDGIKLDANDMALSGKLKLDLLRDIDACGYMYRKDANTVNVTFKQNEKDLTIKSRAQHIADQEFTLSEKKDGEIITYWDKIFLDLKK